MPPIVNPKTAIPHTGLTKDNNRFTAFKREDRTSTTLEELTLFGRCATIATATLFFLFFAKAFFTRDVMSPKST